jgi:hypothetical protein
MAVEGWAALHLVTHAAKEILWYEDNGIKYREYRALFYEDH